MLIQDLIDVSDASLPVIHPEFSIEKILEASDCFKFKFLPVIDNFKIFLGVIEKSKLQLRTKNKDVKIDKYLLSNFLAISGNNAATKLMEIFKPNSKNEIVYVVDNNNKLIGGISAANPSLKYLNMATSFFPTPEILDAIHSAIIIINSKATIVFINHGYGKLAHVPLWKIIGRNMARVEPTSRCLGVLRGNAALVNERIHIESLGIDVIANITPFYKNNKMLGVISVFRDIDETIELSHKLEKIKFINEYLKKQIDNKSQLPSFFKTIIGKSNRLIETLNISAKVAASSINVLIRGESGTGKQVLAEAIHNASVRKRYHMVTINCAAIPESLIEVELFGYEEGSFTGAKKGGKVGKFEMANKGTIFLDEIGDMSLFMQAKILRAIQEKQFERVGGSKSINIDVRIISATNKDLEKMITEGTFREDLYYRLNVVSLILPPLRERKEDIPLLIKYFVDTIVNRFKIKPLHFSEEVMGVLIKYNWYGNIRELRNTIERVSVVCDNNIIYLKDLPSYITDKKKNYFGEINNNIEVGNLHTMIKDIEKQAIIKALEEHNYNKSAAIRVLKISRKTFYKKLREYKLNFRQ